MISKKTTHREETQPESESSFNDSSSSVGEEDGPDAHHGDKGFIVYTDEELDAMRLVQTRLREHHGILDIESRLNSSFLAVATINCKLRVEETATKIAKLLDLMEKLGCPDGVCDDIVDKWWRSDPITQYEFVRHYPPVGNDQRGCQISWIRGSGITPKDKERQHVHACLMQYLSVHSDAKTLRNGTSLVIDLSERNSGRESKVGNERILQSFYQAIPQRPQIILIVGTNLVTRTIVNASIKLASLFLKEKILSRIHFVTIEEARDWFSKGSAPVCAGGDGDGRGAVIENYEEFINERFARLPRPSLG
jgi:hypothetical protein